MSDPIPADARTNILLVDDQTSNLLALEAVLKELDQNLVLASSGREALRHLLSMDFAVILLDVNMPEMDGLETALLIRRRERSRDTPILFLTAEDRGSSGVVKGYEAGAVDYIFKPFVPDVLRWKVRVFVELARKAALVRRQVVLESKNAELEAAKERAERESRFKSQFLASMSHELRTPLSAIIGFSELLEQQGVGPLTTKQAKYVQNVLQGGRHLLTLVNDVLDLAKINSGRFELARDWTYLSVIVESVQRLVAALSEKRKIALQISIPELLPPIWVDSIRMKQALFNLIANAIKFTPPGGAVRVSAREARAILEIVIEDTGVGIGHEDMGRLFREFERLSTEGDGKTDGTGLGLTVTKRLVELHGGTVTVESELGRGSAFTIRLPVKARIDAGASKGLVSKDQADAVVLIESHPHVSARMLQALEAHQFGGVIARSETDVAELCRTKGPAAIVVDVFAQEGATLDALDGAAWSRSVPIVLTAPESQPGRGVIFGTNDCILVPASGEPHLGALERMGVPRDHFAGLRLLVVSSGGEALAALEESTRKAGCEVVTRTDLRREDLDGGSPVDVVVVDLSQDPALCLARLHELEDDLESAALPVIGLVASAGLRTMAFREKLEQLGPTDAWSMDRLIRQLRRTIDQRRPGSSSWDSATGLPSPHRMAGLLRGAIDRAERGLQHLVVVTARLSLLRASGTPPWAQLLRPCLRSDQFVGIAGEDSLGLLAFGATDATREAEAFTGLLRRKLKTEVIDVKTAIYPGDRRRAHEIFVRTGSREGTT